MKEMMKMLEKKKKDGKEIDPMFKDSKMAVLKELRDQMSGLMKDDLNSSKMKKVEVASSDSEGLVEGLDKAKDMLSDTPDAEEFEGPAEAAPAEQVEELAKDASDEDLDAMIAKLESMKQKNSIF